MPRLEKWSITCDFDPYKAPELQTNRLQGLIYEDNRFEDGKIVLTSTLRKLDISNNYAKTNNTEYILGNPSEDWLNWIDENGYKLEDYKL